MIRRYLWTASAVTLILTGLLVAASCSSDELNASAISWTITDSCDDGLGIQVRFFDEDNGNVFPSPTTYYVVGSGGSTTFSLDCIRDHFICFGATTDPESATTWGVGMNGDDACAGCCSICGDGLFAEDDLTCP